MSNRTFFTDTLKAAGWTKLGMGTHSHQTRNDNGVELNIGLNEDEGEPTFDVEIVIVEDSSSVLLSIEPGTDDELRTVLTFIIDRFRDVEPDGIMDFAELVAGVCPTYAEPCKITEDAGYEHDEDTEDWIALG